MAKSKRRRPESSHQRALRASVAVGALPLQLLGAILRRPGKTFAFLLTAGASMAIITNALSEAQGPHPAPLFDTRSAAPAVPNNATPVAPRRQTFEAAPEPVHTASVAPQPDVDQAERALVGDIQRSLSALGLYSGEVDGLMGPKTEAAIRDYQSSRDLALTGLPTASLREHLGRSASAAASGTATTDADPVSEMIEASQRDGSASFMPSPKPKADPVVLKVQEALQSSGYGPLDVDGLMGQQTRNAIERFEQDKGLEVTGAVSDRLLAQLILAGALPD